MTTPLEACRAYAYTLEPDQRHQILAWLRLAELLTIPPRTIAYGKFPDTQERRRRALLPRPNCYYPGNRDFRGHP